MKRVTISIAASIILLLILGNLASQRQIDALASNQTQKPPEITINQSSINQRLMDANTKFGLNLFKTIVKENPKNNVFISPTSVAIALSMLYNGAQGATKEQIAKTLEVSGISLTNVNDSAKNLQDILTKADGVKLSIANSLWLKKGIAFEADFLDNNQKFYGAKAANLDFANPKTVKTINEWVKENTNNKIDRIIETISPDDVLFIINAIYFQGNWSQAFEEKSTKLQPFFLANGSQKQQLMMSQKGEYKYYENDLFQAIRLPYGKGKMSMYIFLPRGDLNSFFSQLTQENWQQWLTEFTKRKGSITMPKFKLEYEAQLKKVLSTLGMANVFSAKEANFNKMTKNKVYVNEIKHKTVLDVNETGTEAAAVTSIGMRATSIAIEEKPPFNLIINRPFFLVIRDEQSGTLLFTGSINQP